MPDLLHYVCDKCKKSFYANGEATGAPAACPWCLSRSISRYGRTEPARSGVQRTHAGRAEVESQGIEVFTKGLVATSAGTETKAIVAWVAFKNGHEIAHDSRVASRGLDATSNAVDLMAIVDALRWAYDKGYSGLRVYSDNSYAVNWASGEYNTNQAHIIPIRQEALELAKKVCPKLEQVPADQNKAQGLCRETRKRVLEGDSYR